MNESTSPIPSVTDYAVSESPVSTSNLSEPPVSVEPAPLPPKKKKHLLLWLILLPVCLLLVLAIAVGGVFAYWYTRPEEVLKGAVSNYLSGFVTENERSVLERIEKADQQGKIHFDLRQSDLSEQDFSMDVYSDVQQEKGMIDLSYGEDTLKWYVAPDQWVLSGSMTGNEALGVKPEGLYQQYEQSVFGSPDKSSASLSLNTYQKIALRDLLDELENSDLFTAEQDSVDYGEKYFDLLLSLLEEHSTATVSSEDGVQNNTYVFTPDGLSALVNAFLDELKKDMEELDLADTELNISLTDAEQPTKLSQLLVLYRRELETSIEQMKSNGQSATLTITSKIIPHALQKVEFAITSDTEDTVTYTLTATEENACVLTCTEGEEEKMRITYLSYGGVRRIYVDALNHLQRMQRMMDLSLTYVPGQSYEIHFFILSDGVQITMTVYGDILEDTEDAYVLTLDRMTMTAIKGNQCAMADQKYGLTVGFYPNEEMPEFPAPSADLFALSIADVMRIEQNSGHTMDELKKHLKDYLNDYKAK